MALIFMDGLDGYTNDVDLLTKWDFINPGQINYHATNGRFGGGCLAGSGGNHDLGAGKMFLDNPTGTAASTDEFHIGFSFYTPSDIGTDTVFLLNLQSSNGFFNMRLELDSSDMSLVATRSKEMSSSIGKTELGSSSAGVISTSTWHWIEMRCVIHGSTGLVEVKVDDTQVINLTSQNTAGTTALDVVGVFFGVNKEAANLWRYDDIVIFNSGGDAPNDFLGDSRIDTLRPDGAGDSSDSTASAGTRHEAVDDAGQWDGDTTYVELSTAADQDLYEMDDLGSDPATIHAVTVNIAARATSSEPREFRAKVKSGATEGNGATKWAGNQSEYHLHQEFFIENPDTTSPWTGAEVDAIQIGQEVVS